MYTWNSKKKFAKSLSFMPNRGVYAATFSHVLKTINKTKQVRTVDLNVSKDSKTGTMQIQSVKFWF